MSLLKINQKLNKKKEKIFNKIVKKKRKKCFKVFMSLVKRLKKISIFFKILAKIFNNMKKYFKQLDQQKQNKKSIILFRIQTVIYIYKITFNKILNINKVKSGNAVSEL